MMIVDLPLSAEDAELVALLSDYADRRVRPNAARADAEQGLDPSAFTDLERLGLLTAIDERYGGQEAPRAGLRLVLLEVLAGADSGLAIEAAAHAAALSAIQATAADEAARRLLEPFVSRDARATVAYFEGHGRSSLELQTAAAYSDGGWRLRGAKRTVVRPSSADLAVVVGQVDGEPTAFAVRGRPAQWRVVRDDRDAGKLGLRSAATGEVAFTDLPAERLGGGDGLHRSIAWYRLALASIAVGVASASLDYAVRYAKQRVAFGREIIDFQGVEFPLVESDIALDLARLDIQDAWATVDGGVAAEVTADRVARTVALAMPAAVDATRIGVNTLGGHGYLADHPQERFYRDATTLAMVDFDPLYDRGYGY